MTQKEFEDRTKLKTDAEKYVENPGSDDPLDQVELTP